jgi:hypothetical protein
MSINDVMNIRYLSNYLRDSEKEKFFRKNTVFKLPLLRTILLIINLLLLAGGFILPKIVLELSVSISEAFYLHSPIASFFFDLYQLNKVLVVVSIVTLPILFLSWFYRSYINCYALGETTNENPVMATFMLGLPGANLMSTFLRLRELLMKFGSKLHIRILALSWAVLLVYISLVSIVSRGEAVAFRSFEGTSLYAGFQVLKAVPIFNLNYLYMVADISLLMFVCILIATIYKITISQRNRNKTINSANQLLASVTELDSNSALSRYFLFLIGISVGFIFALAVIGPIVYHWDKINRVTLQSDYRYYLENNLELNPFSFQSLMGYDVILTLTLMAGIVIVPIFFKKAK